MDAWPERQRNLSNYSLPLLGLSRYPHHCSYKLTSSQRTSILQSSLSPTQLGFSLCKLSPTLSFTKAFISMDIHHNFPFLTIFQSFILSIHHGFCESKIFHKHKFGPIRSKHRHNFLTKRCIQCQNISLVSSTKFFMLNCSLYWKLKGYFWI